VEGNIGVGKTEFAKRLAHHFDLKYFPPTREKQCYVLPSTDYHFDFRGFDPLLPEGVQSYDLKKFYSDPHPENGLVGRLQLLWYRERFMDYLLALRHLANTGVYYSGILYCLYLHQTVSDSKYTLCDIPVDHSVT